MGGGGVRELTSIGYEVFGIIFLIVMSDFIAKVPFRIGTNILSTIAYSSMAIYLFHRHIYTIGLKTFETLGLSANYWLCYLVLLPLVIVTCYYIQKVYDLIVDELMKKHLNNPK